MGEGPAFIGVRITAASSGFELTRIGSVPGAVLARSNGDLVVSHPTTRQLIVFDRTGRRKTVLGGAGEEPGEFASIDGLGELGDTTWVRDASRYRFSLFRSDYTFLRTVTVVRTWGMARPANVLALLAGGRAYGTVPGTAAGSPQRGRSPDAGVPLAVARHDATDAREIAFLARRTFVPTLRVGRSNISLSFDEV